jgi:hypothetical protein
VLFANFKIAAQQSRTLFFMHDLPQASYVNPAIQPSCNVLIGIPALSSFYVNASSTGLSYNDLSSGGNQIDAVSITDKLKNINFATFELHLNLITVGVKYNDFYFSFNIADKINAKAFYPKALTDLAVYGNDEYVGKTITTLGLGASAYHLREYSLGIAQDVDWNYKWGLRGKLLFGKANLNSRKSGLSLSTEADTYDLLASWAYQINTSFPINIPSDNNFAISDIEVGEVNPVKYLLNSSNKGFAIDFGFVYVTEQFTWSGSILDLGAIYWKSDVNQLNSTGNFAFDGILINDNLNPDEFLEMITDSISNQLRVSSSQKSYFTSLPTKINIGATYELHPNLNAGVLLRTEFYPRRPVSSATLSINTSQLKYFSASASYSIMNGSYNNIGLGLGLGKPNFTFHIISDNILGFVWPNKAHTANLRFGMNLLFGCKKKVKSFKYSGPGCYWVID